MTPTSVELRDVFCVHRTAEGDAAALQGTNLSVGLGEIVCLLGPSGAGKTTCLEVVAGLRPPSAGSVTVLGREMGRLGTRARAQLRHRRLGLLGQWPDGALCPDLLAHEAIALPLALRGAGRAERRARARDLLAAAGLSHCAAARPPQLSGGERQRLALCAALAHRPSLLIADEPTGELDGQSADVMCGLIRDLAAMEGFSALVASHDPLIGTFADRTVTIRDGRIVEERTSGGSALVVGRGGSLSLPFALREAAAIDDRVRVEPGPDGLLLRPAPAAPTQPPLRPDPATGAARTATDWAPASVQVDTLVRRYGGADGPRAVLDGLSHRFACGQLTVIRGRSGTGKTTLLRLIAGLDQPTGGAAWIGETAVSQLGPEERATLRRRLIGYMAQQAEPVPFLSAQENVRLVLELRGWPALAAASRSESVLDAVGLFGRAAQRVHRLSAGETQRVALARALASARGLLIVDEPTSHLDEASARRVARLLKAAAREDRQTVICATHDAALEAEADELLSLEPA